MTQSFPTDYEEEWILEWSESDSIRCWVELLQLWLSGEVKECLQLDNTKGNLKGSILAEPGSGGCDEWAVYSWKLMSERARSSQGPIRPTDRQLAKGLQDKSMSDKEGQ